MIEFTEAEIKEILCHYESYAKDIREGWAESSREHFAIVNSIIAKLSHNVK